jgi:type II secretory pathway pseudopilin PulG
MKNIKAWFTIVELIVVITILSILWTVGFLSYHGYRTTARDSVRLADISTIEKSLHLYQQRNWTLPPPSNPFNINYSWSIVWTQWTFWKSMIRNIQNISEAPKDPISWLEYTYSILNNKREFQIAGILEWWDTALNSPYLINHAYVDSKRSAKAMVKWNYNGQLAKVTSGSTTYILAVPTIISWDITLSSIDQLINQKKLVFKNYSNLPTIYSGSTYETDGWFDYNPTKLVVFEWNTDDITNNETKRLEFLINVQEAYSGTIIEQSSNIKPLLANTVNIDDISDKNRYLASKITNEILNTNITVWTTDSNINFNGTPKSWNYMPDDVSLLYRKWSIYTYNWDNNTCDYSTMNIVNLNPGTDTIPSTLIENTIYKLSPWDYIVSGKIVMNNCNALIWDKNNPANIYSSAEIISEGILDIRPKEGIILYGLTLNWESNWLWSTHNKNIAWLNFRFSKNLTINNVEFNKSWYWVYIYDSKNINVINTKASYNNDTWIYSYGSGKMIFDNITSNNNTKHGIFTNASGWSKWDNLFYNIYVYSNWENGLNIYWSESRIISNVKTYNNTWKWLSISYGFDTSINDVISYWNTDWLILQHFNWLTLENILSYNNSEIWLRTYAVWDITANNITTHDNQKSWFYNLSEKWTNKYTDITSYKNAEYWFYIRKSSSSNDVIDNITTYSNTLDGILLYWTNGLIGTNLKSYNNSGAGMKLTYNEWWITINDSEFYSNNWSWIDTWAMWGMNLSNLITYNNTGNWIFNSATKLSNNFTNIKTYSNSLRGFYIRSSWSKNDNLEKIISYNNWSDWIQLYQINEVNINNCISFNNTWNGYTTWYSSKNTINNSQFFNNWQSWIYFNIWNDQVVNNSFTYNNGLYWLWFANSQANKLHNVAIYNNTNKGLYTSAGGVWDGSWLYYGNTSIYWNSDNLTPKLTQGVDWFLWYNNGILNNSWTFDQNLATTLNNTWWDFSVQWKQNITLSWNELFNFGASIPKQTQPVKYLSTSNTLYGTDWIEYNTNKFIWE